MRGRGSKAEAGNCGGAGFDLFGGQSRRSMPAWTSVSRVLRKRSTQVPRRAFDGRVGALRAERISAGDRTVCAVSVLCFWVLQERQPVLQAAGIGF